MTRQERKDKMVKIVENMDFPMCTCVYHNEMIADFILSEQAKAVKEVVEPVKECKEYGILIDAWYPPGNESHDAVDRTLSIAKEYTEDV